MAKEKRKFKKKKSFDELPEPIIQHILSFLPEKDAAKTSILSKAWLSAWRTKPNLEFNCYEFLHSTGLGEKEKGSEKYLSKYIKRTLKRYTEQKISIETLDLANVYGVYSPVDSEIVQRCTRVAVERGVKKLHLCGYRVLPDQIIVGAKSLVDLSLDGFNMVNLSTEKLMWDGLKRLCLLSVNFDEAMFENIISSCTLLEIFEISYYSNRYDEQFGNFQFKVIEHHNLMQLNVTLRVNQRLMVAQAPKLESLTYKNVEVEDDGDDWISCGLSLHSSQYQYLKKLRFYAVGITDDFFNNFEQKFPHLKHLSVGSCQDLRRIKISSQSLERIKLKENFKLEKAHFDVPSIELLEYVCKNPKCSIIPEFSFTPTEGKVRWISKLRIRWTGHHVDGSWFLQVKKLLANLIPSDIFLDIGIDIGIDGSIEFDMNEIRNSVTFRDELQELQELSLRLPLGLDSSSIQSALDGFFWICRPNIISQYWGVRQENDELTKLLYDMLILRRNEDEHHKSQQQMNKAGWQHDLMQAKVQIYDSGKRRVGDAILHLKEGLLDDQQPEALEWESIFKVLSSPAAATLMIYFTLNWKKHSMSTKE